MALNIPSNFALFNAATAKNLIVAVVIDGVPDVLASGPVGQKLRYGQPVTYGQSGLVYGGITPYVTSSGGTVKQLISIDKSALNITQTCEPEQGRSSVSQMQVSFIDLNGYMTNLCTPGAVIPDILGANVKVYLGFKEISFPEDYLLVFRGVIQAVQTSPGVYTLSIGDPNVKRRQSLFYQAQTILSSDIDSSTTTIPVLSTADFHTPITDGNGNVDSAVTCYITVDSEIMSYTQPSAVSGTSFTVTRGARGSTPASHTAGTAINATIQIGANAVNGGINPMQLALKLMLSGWDGPWIYLVALNGLGYGSGTSIANGIFLPTPINAVQDYGLTIGDFVTISGDTYSGNNVQVTITGFQDLNGYPNSVILTNFNFTTSANTPGTAAFRSQYDTLPITCGLSMTPDQVDVAQHQYLESSFLNSNTDNLAFYLTSVESSGKQFIETEVYLPVSAYSVTRQGQCSVALVLPPIAGQTLSQIDYTNVLDPQNIQVQRDVSNRNFFNEVDWSYDPLDDGTIEYYYNLLDATTLTSIGISSVLPITANGLRNAITSQTVLQERSQRFLGRYAGAASLINLKTTFGAANTISPGTVVLLVDNNKLKIPNWSTGTQYLSQQLYEVRNWSLDIKSGSGTIQLLQTSGFNTQDRFATIAPSSYCAASGNTTTSVIIVPSFNAYFGANEYQKWSAYVGATLVFHNYSWSVSSTAVLQSVSPANVLTLSSALSFTPDNTTIVDFASYPSSGETLEKLIHCFLDRSAPITVSNTATSFTVSTSDAAYFQVGFPVIVHPPNWSTATFPVNGQVIDGFIESVNTGTGVITITNPNSSMYTPAVGDLCEILSFADLGVGYRLI